MDDVSNMLWEEELAAKLARIVELEERHAPFGISLALRGDNPTGVVSSADLADYIVAVIERSADLRSRIDSIPVPDLTPPV